MQSHTLACALRALAVGSSTLLLSLLLGQPLQAADVSEWKAAGFDGRSARKWIEADYSLQEALAWKEVVLAYEHDETNLKEANAWQRMGFDVAFARIFVIDLGGDRSDARRALRSPGSTPMQVLEDRALSQGTTWTDLFEARVDAQVEARLRSAAGVSTPPGDPREPAPTSVPAPAHPLGASASPDNVLSSDAVTAPREAAPHTVRTTTTDPMRTAALHEAVEAGDLAGLDRLLAEGVDPDAPDADGWTPLMLAIAAARHQVMDLLLEAGADTDVVAPDGTASLHLAAALGDMVAARKLVDAGAALELRDGSGFTPMMYGTSQLQVAFLSDDSPPQEHIAKMLKDAGALQMIDIINAKRRFRAPYSLQHIEVTPDGSEVEKLALLSKEDQETIARYQREVGSRYGLAVTGQLDRPTVEVLEQERRALRASTGRRGRTASGFLNRWHGIYAATKMGCEQLDYYDVEPNFTTHTAMALWSEGDRAYWDRQFMDQPIEMRKRSGSFRRGSSREEVVKGIHEVDASTILEGDWEFDPFDDSLHDKRVVDMEWRTWDVVDKTGGTAVISAIRDSEGDRYFQLEAGGNIFRWFRCGDFPLPGDRS